MYRCWPCVLPLLVLLPLLLGEGNQYGDDVWIFSLAWGLKTPQMLLSKTGYGIVIFPERGIVDVFPAHQADGAELHEGERRSGGAGREKPLCSKPFG